jgi:ABC-type transport system involved in cytochrome bd biosynthesis fused ATPase/permease subunit
VRLDPPSGRRIAVVGPSGGGKCTRLLTLARLLPPVDGHISPDGTDMAALEHAALCRTMHLCADDAHVSITTVPGEPAGGRPRPHDTDLGWALERSGLTDWLAGLPNGLDTMVGDPSGPGAGLGG